MRTSVCWLAAAALVGCSGETMEPEQIVPPPMVDDSTDFVPLPENNSIDAAILAVEGFAAYDGLTDEWRATAEGNGLPSAFPGIRFILVDSGGTRGCIVDLIAEEPLAPADWITDRDAFIGLEFAPGEGTVVDGCAGAELPDVFNGDVGAAIQQWTWGLGLAPLDNDTRLALSQQLPAAEWNALEPLLIGATFYSNFLLEFTVDGETVDHVSTGYARGFEVDENFAVAVGGAGDLQNVPSADIYNGVDVASAYYEFTPSIVFPNGTVLASTPPTEGGTGDTANP